LKNDHLSTSKNDPLKIKEVLFISSSSIGLGAELILKLTVYRRVW